MRWLMAFLVIFSHAGPLAGFYGGEDLGTQISKEQSLGGVAVCGFFFFSGFLITKSRMGKSTIWRYFWRRCLRIFPAFWTALLLTVGVLAPIGWWKEHGTFAGYWTEKVEAPLTYFISNMFLELNQRNIAGLGGQLPYFLLHSGRDWNGSAWTLKYEFLCYIMIGFAGLFGILAHRYLAASIAGLVIFLNALQWLHVPLIELNPHFFTDRFFLMLVTPFVFGMLFALFPEKIPMDDRLGVFAGLVAFGAYATGGWLVFGQFFFGYFLMWLAVRLPLQNWEKYGDFSYGVYIFAWPMMTFVTFFGLEKYGWWAYHVTIVVSVHILAFLSWHLIEKPAMSLKNWYPAPLRYLVERGRPAYNWVRERIVYPDFSSTRYAQSLREVK